jgi:hypothetical protein
LADDVLYAGRNGFCERVVDFASRENGIVESPIDHPFDRLTRTYIDQKPMVHSVD